MRKMMLLSLAGAVAGVMMAPTAASAQAYGYGYHGYSHYRGHDSRWRHLQHERWERARARARWEREHRRWYRHHNRRYRYGY